jgi:23S rRNA (adenine2503-C2)-methyltransferase
MADENGVSIVPRRITVSTSGIVPRIRDFARESIRPHLAISLSGTTDEQRTAIMPINRKYPPRGADAGSAVSFRSKSASG